MHSFSAFVYVCMCVCIHLYTPKYDTYYYFTSSSFLFSVLCAKKKDYNIKRKKKQMWMKNTRKIYHTQTHSRNHPKGKKSRTDRQRRRQWRRDTAKRERETINKKFHFINVFYRSGFGKWFFYHCIVCLICLCFYYDLYISANAWRFVLLLF